MFEMEAVVQQMPRLQLEVQILQVQLQVRPSVTKDLSLLSLLPKWADRHGGSLARNFWSYRRHGMCQEAGGCRYDLISGFETNRWC